MTDDDLARVLSKLRAAGLRRVVLELEPWPAAASHGAGLQPNAKSTTFSQQDQAPRDLTVANAPAESDPAQAALEAELLTRRLELAHVADDDG